MKKPTDNSIDEIAEKLSKNMKGYNHFFEYRKNLIDIILKREPGILFNPLENTNPYIYIDNPIQLVPLDKIENLPPQAIAAKNGLEQYAKDGIEPNAGAFHGARLGRQVEIPIAVKINSDGTFTITDGFHRTSQAVISKNKNILAFVEGGNGPTLKEIFDIVLFKYYGKIMNMTKDEALNQIADRLSKEMTSFETFDEYKKNLIYRLNKREPDVPEHTFAIAPPENYINNPLQILPTKEIANTWDLGTSFKEILQDMASKGKEPKTPQAFHGTRLGKHVDTPIAVENDPDGLFYIVDGICRGYQAVVSGDKDMLAFVAKGDGPTLEEVFNKVKNSKQ
ncbi:hypothetical protein A3G48_02180 [Candidatus Nomurabacteria bacterium RIFCSPLOWO2_12_FULL_40_42]|uniref:ParB/Sulfiredoxin domain-containing protein n=1 Tax=Candidatus Nomurabacteria bacterium RIFCSPLOWO2_02_FULL_40_67 TaxID=1801787 RepID=A0A1F6Y7K5_9BACT|nr:MAG: hypothetical protein A2W56_00445 [Candidatus Nomurabacteria bacterium RIFCSPHIGHO2_02_41_18]OGJ02316.1 MAG: hypothetical protein A3I23_02875 [Candidatus Nomurabacteria bacterium RIFCSPLOWO2_02_FULL_40_67]OGJ04083.1 MAG: hypothetical protein A3G48_02180 [Candidatus Nomurabacteria bacterium RIFCSPLOWO2_12_FULL_40_42]